MIVADENAGDFIPLDVAAKLAVSLDLGLFAGLEREWSRKDVGVRTFALTALLGTLSSLISNQFSLACMGVVVLAIALMNTRALMLRQNLEITTSVSLVVDFSLGVLVGSLAEEAALRETRSEQLFKPVRLGRYHLPHRLAMAPLTRSRAATRERSHESQCVLLLPTRFGCPDHW